MQLRGGSLLVMVGEGVGGSRVSGQGVSRAQRARSDITVTDGQACIQMPYFRRSTPQNKHLGSGSANLVQNLLWNAEMLFEG